MQEKNMVAFFAPDVIHGKIQHVVAMGLFNIKTQLPPVISGVAVCHFILPH